jgi:hypothetical protein
MSKYVVDDSNTYLYSHESIAPTLLPMDAMVRFTCDKGSEFTAHTVYRISSNTHSPNIWCGLGLDGGHKAGHQL